MVGWLPCKDTVSWKEGPRGSVENSTEATSETGKGRDTWAAAAARAGSSPRGRGSRVASSGGENLSGRSFGEAGGYGASGGGEGGVSGGDDAG